MLNQDPISAAELAEVESLYRKITTPWRCRLSLHRWSPWKYVMSVHFGAIEIGTGRTSAPGQIDLSIRVCPACTKTQAKAQKVAQPKPMDLRLGGEE